MIHDLSKTSKNSLQESYTISFWTGQSGKLDRGCRHSKETGSTDRRTDGIDRMEWQVGQDK